jgi:hypothetical protein
MTKLGFLLLVGAVIVILGCSTISVTVDYDSDIDFTQYKTFDWIEYKEKAPLARAREHSLFEKRLKAAVEGDLYEMGYEIITVGKPDFLIAYHIGAKDKVDVDRYGYRYGPRGRWIGHSVEVHRYKERTLILDFVDPKLKQLVWRGTAVGTLRDMAAGEDAVYDAVSRILAQFPPPGR